MLARSLAAIAVLAVLPAPLAAHERDDARDEIVLNGRIDTADFTGGVGQGAAYASEDCCYGGGVYFAGGSSGAGAMSAASAFAFARASAFARAGAFAHGGHGMGHGHR